MRLISPTETPAYEIRPANEADLDFLWDMLFEALFVPPGRDPFPRTVLEQTEIRRYVEGFGKQAGDVGFVAVVQAENIGAVWVRAIRGYGYVDDQTPELTMAVRPEWQGRGVGTALMARIVDVVPRVSLSSDQGNPARKLYHRFGFVPVARDGTTVTMLRQPDQ